MHSNIYDMNKHYMNIILSWFKVIFQINWVIQGAMNTIAKTSKTLRQII